MTEKQIRSWEKKRARGKGSFVLWYGVFGWGIPLAIGMSLYEYARDKDLSTALLVLYFLTMPCAGFFYGVFMWNYMEKRYCRSTASKPTL
jgi:hypothetical protein